MNYAGFGEVIIDGKVFALPVYVGDAGAKNASPGDKVVIEMVRFPTHFQDGEGVIVDVLGAMVSAGTLGKHKAHIDKPVDIPMGEFTGQRWSNAP